MWQKSRMHILVLSVVAMVLSGSFAVADSFAISPDRGAVAGVSWKNFASVAADALKMKMVHTSAYAPIQELVKNAQSCVTDDQKYAAAARYKSFVKDEEIRLYNSLPSDKLNDPTTFDNVESIANLWKYLESKCTLKPSIYSEISEKLGYEIHELSPKLNVLDSLLKFTAPQAKEAGSKMAEKYLTGTGGQVSTGKSETKPKVSANPTCLGKALCVSGKIKKTIDGDTIYIDKYKVRLSLVDSPEKGKKGYFEAKSFTSKLCKTGTIAHIDQDDSQPKDRYGRILGKVTCSDKNLNSELLASKHAQILEKYCQKSEFSGESWAKKHGC